jgi:N-acetyl-gamma-glutamyl-phosphate reductase
MKLIDLSGDFRLKDVSQFENWYGIKHECPELLSESVYGLPELYYEQIQSAKFIANPGCYPTGIILGLAPVIQERIAGIKRIIINSVSGFSGAGRGGRNKNNLAANVVDNIKAYKITNHPHTAEVEQELGKLCGEEVKVTFVPHVAGFERGIINTMYLELEKTITQEELYQRYLEFYRGKPFVRVCGDEEPPEIKNVIYTNFCDIGVNLNYRTGMVIITTVLDNLVKGASGQAIQNMNLMSHYNECESL